MRRRPTVCLLAVALCVAVAAIPGGTPGAGAGTGGRASGSGAGAGRGAGSASAGGFSASLDPLPDPLNGAGAPDPTFRPREFTVLGAGDVLLHGGFWPQAATAARATGATTGYDFGPLFASVRDDVEGADLAICHLETPLGTPGGPFSGYPIFNVPPQVTTALRDVGYDDCDTASNHTLDKGEAGVTRTLDALDAVGITHTGSARSAAEAGQLDMLRINGVSVAHLAYTNSFNGIPLPPDKPWLGSPLEVSRVLADAHRARLAGASVVIVSLHWGTEYQHAPDGYQLSVARQVLASPDVDLILGAHAHVVQPMEKIGTKWVAYGMGNEVAWQHFAQDTRDGVMPRFTFTEVSPGQFTVTKAEAVPTFMWLDGGPATLIDLPAALADPAVNGARRAAYQASWRRTAGYLLSRGAGEAGLRVLG